MRGLNLALIIFHPSRLRAVSQGKFGPLAAFVLYTQRKRAGRQRHSSYLQGAAAGRRAAPVSAGRAVPCSEQTRARFPPRGRQGPHSRGAHHPSARLRAPTGPPCGAATGRCEAALSPPSPPHPKVAAGVLGGPPSGGHPLTTEGQGRAALRGEARRGEARRGAAGRGGPRASPS